MTKQENNAIIRLGNFKAPPHRKELSYEYKKKYPFSHNDCIICYRCMANCFYSSYIDDSHGK